MPWSVKKGGGNCPEDKPFAVINDKTGESEGCHATEEGAQKQVAALYENSPDDKKSGRYEAAINGVEIARTGRWKLSTGEIDITPEMLDDAARYATEQSTHSVPLRLGHNDPRFDGEPALGWLENLRVEGKESGDPVLVGDLTGMPAWLEESMPTAWPRRSMEGWRDLDVDGQNYSMVVDGLALLGVTPPGIESIKSLKDLPKALGIAASSSHFAASYDPHKKETEEVSQPKNEVKGAKMDKNLLRKALGLDENSTDEEVISAFFNANLQKNDPGNEVSANTTSTSTTEVETELVNAKNLPTKVVDGTVMVDAAIVASLQKAAMKGEEAYKRLQYQECKDILDNAIKAGKFPPSRREHYQKLWDLDPEGTKKHIECLAANVIPISASGYMGDDVQDFQNNITYNALYPEAK